MSSSRTIVVDSPTRHRYKQDRTMYSALSYYPQLETLGFSAFLWKLCQEARLGVRPWAIPLNFLIVLVTFQCRILILAIYARTLALQMFTNSLASQLQRWRNVPALTAPSMFNINRTRSSKNLFRYISLASLSTESSNTRSHTKISGQNTSIRLRVLARLPNNPFRRKWENGPA